MNHEIYAGSSLPAGWDAFSLGSKASFVTSGSRGWARFYSESGDLFLRSQNIRSGHLDLEDRQHVLPPGGAEGERTRVQPNDLLVTITGNSVGNVAISSDDLGIAYISQHVGMIRLVNPSLAPYACWYLSPGAPGNRQIIDAQTGQSKPGLNLQNLKDLVVAAPKDKRERDLIVAALDDIQAQADEMQMLLSKKRMLKQAAMQELLTGKRRLPGFEGEWEVKRLGDEIRDLEAGVSVRSATDKDRQSTGRYILKTSAVSQGRFSPTERKEIIPCDITRAKTPITQGDLIISRMNTPALVGECGYSHSDHPNLFLPDRLWRAAYRDPHAVSSRWLSYTLSTQQNRSRIKELATGTSGSMKNISKRALLDLVIKWPSLEEQIAIAEALSDMDGDIDSIYQQLQKAQAVKQGMMQQLLTGKIRLVGSDP